MKVMGHLMSIWGQRVLKEMVKEVSGHTYGPLITQCMVLKCSMVLAKGDFGTWFSLTHGIGDFSNIEGGKGKWKRHACIFRELFLRPCQPRVFVWGWQTPSIHSGLVPVV